LESKGTREGWLEKAFREGQDPQRVVVPIIIIIIIIIGCLPLIPRQGKHKSSLIWSVPYGGLV
jgi:hypothetical protein